MIIIDMGSGNTCRNDWDYVKKMIESLAMTDTHSHEVIIKWQLFLSAGKNIPLSQEIFAKAVVFAWGHGYRTSASVFDGPSLQFLLRATEHFDLPFVKLANNPKVYYLANMVPDGIRVIKSVGSKEEFGLDTMCCVSDYPANIKQYKSAFSRKMLSAGISDHTTDWTLYNEYKPEIYEVHFRLEDSSGLDAGPFARTPSQLKEIL